MRVSVEHDDPGYRPDAMGCTIIFNGEKLNHCLTADEEQGRALVLKTDDQGALIVNAAGDRVEELWLEGEVIIVRNWPE